MHQIPQGQSFEAIYQEAKTLAGLNMPDVVVPLPMLNMTREGLLEVPHHGALQLTDWSRRQLAAMLGLNWSRWFDEKIITADERAEEVNRRLSRLSYDRRLRARRPAATEHLGADGILRGFLTESYAPIDDVQILGTLQQALGQEASRFQFTRVRWTDQSTHLTATAQDRVDAGADTRDDLIPGFYVRNSEVGFAALTIDIFLFRLICTNGLVVGESARLLYRVHRAITAEVMLSLLERAVSRLRGEWERTIELLRQSRRAPVHHADRVIVEALRRVRLARHTLAVQKAYAEEGEETRFAVVQAITRVAQSITDPDERFEMERLGGQVLLQAA